MRCFMSRLSKPVRWLIFFGLFILCGMTASSPLPLIYYCSNVLAVALIVFVVLSYIYKPSKYVSRGKIANIEVRGDEGITIRRLAFPENMDEILNTSDYLVLDTETTGLDPADDKIVQIAIVTVKNGEPVNTFTSFVNPKRHMPEEASKINHITDADLVGAPSEKKIAGTVLSMIDGQTVVVHNAKFDLEFIDRWAVDAKLSVSVNCIDTIPMAKKAFPGLSGYSLQKLNKVLKIKSIDSHRADADALATQQVFEMCKSELRIHQQKMEQHKKDIAVKHTQIKPTVENFEKSHPLYRKTIVFSGHMGMTREHAMQAAVNCGAILRGSITSKTDYLCCGEPIYADFGRSKKKEQAIQLNQSGEGHIKIITEQEFYDLIMQKT